MEQKHPITNYSYQTYYEVVESIINGIINSIDFTDIHKYIDKNTSKNSKYKKSLIYDYIKQLRNYLRDELQKKFMRISEEMKFAENLKEIHEIKSKKKILEELNVVGKDLIDLSPQAYVDFLLSIDDKLGKVNEDYDRENKKFDEENFQDENSFK